MKINLDQISHSHLCSRFFGYLAKGLQLVAGPGTVPGYTSCLLWYNDLMNKYSQAWISLSSF